MNTCLRPTSPPHGSRTLAWRTLHGLLLLLLVACAGTPNTSADEPAPDLASPVSRTVSKAANATTMPLDDLNLKRREIPAALRAAQRAPYAITAEETCAELLTELSELHASLGPDVDAAAGDTDKPHLLVQGVELAGDTAVSMVRGTAEAVLPMRVWVRRLSGAEQHSKDWAAAIAAGGFRRAFLKGYARARGCEPAP